MTDWTRTPPTREGLYTVAYLDGTVSERLAVCRFDKRGVLLCEHGGHRGEARKFARWWWPVAGAPKPNHPPPREG